MADKKRDVIDKLRKPTAEAIDDFSETIKKVASRFIEVLSKIANDLCTDTVDNTSSKAKAKVVKEDNDNE